MERYICCSRRSIAGEAHARGRDGRRGADGDPVADCCGGGVLDRFRASSDQLECVNVGAVVQGREASVTFVSRSETADLPYPWGAVGEFATDNVWSGPDWL